MKVQIFENIKKEMFSKTKSLGMTLSLIDANKTTEVE